MSPKVLVFDVESSPIIASVWGRYQQNIGLNQIKSDRHIMSWAAKWFKDAPEKVMYRDQRNAKNMSDDKALLQGIWELLDEAQVVITQNGKGFDSPLLNARFLLNGMKPPSPYKHIDTLQIAKKVAQFTSNKLEYLTDKLCTKYKKLSHSKYPGMELWNQCLARNKAAWNEMKRYNIHDVLSTEELAIMLMPWDNSLNFDVYSDRIQTVCTCGSTHFEARGFAYTTTGKFQRFVCRSCGRWTANKRNLLSVSDRASLHKSAGEL